MINYEVGELVRITTATNPMLNFDSVQVFYYDETNNIKKFYVREEDFNYSFHSNFVLGGVVYQGTKPNVAELFSNLDLQSNVKEVKLKHLAKGEFLDCLKSKKLNYFLKYVLNSSLKIHYSSLNILFFSIVDIVDSAIANSEVAQQLGFPFAQKLKDDLYKLCKLEIEEVIDLFYSFKYPNIKKEEVLPFIKALIGLFADYEDDLEFHLGLTSLKQILRESEKKGTLPFIMDEEDYVMLKEFSQFYLRPIYTFRNSTHIFDKEADIEKTVSEYNITIDGTSLNNYSFIDSQSDPLIQVSDILVGLVGKLSYFVNTNSKDEINAAIASLNELQLDTLDAYLDLVIKSEKENAAYFHNFDAVEEILKHRFILKLRNKI